MVNIEQLFQTSNETVDRFFSKNGLGFYIPKYQRNYSWDVDNIKQLLEDIYTGIERKIGCSGDEGIRFMGAVILVTEQNAKNNIHPIEVEALPTRIDKVIDGQQRISTIVYFTAILYKYLRRYHKEFDKVSLPCVKGVLEVCEYWEDRLMGIFTVDLGVRNESKKPKIIRENEDQWTRTKTYDDAYKSNISNYIASVIDSIYKNKEYPTIEKKGGNDPFHANVKAIDSWLDQVVCKRSSENSFPDASNILDGFGEENIWRFEREDLKNMLNDLSEENRKNKNLLSELVQVISICHYLLDRCCFTVIQPVSEEWAFDMFQSLNATGTSLTAIETFKPVVISDTKDYNNSLRKLAFDKIDKLIKNTKDDKDKNKVTNELLTSFFVSYCGETVSTHFSVQRKMLIDYYNRSSNHLNKDMFIRYLGDYAAFNSNIWRKISKDFTLNFSERFEDKSLVECLLAFLYASKHKMAITVLGRYYEGIINKRENSELLFIEAIKAVSAFYLLWRATNSNSGLDKTYRDFFKNNQPLSESDIAINIDKLKESFRECLKDKGVLEKEDWLKKAFVNANYNSAGISVCKLMLMISFHDTIVDPANKNLMKVSRKGVNDCLSIDKWYSNSFKTIEHIAPRSFGGGWTDDLYKDDDSIHMLGNLTLLPTEINSIASNKGWDEKVFYYRCLAVADDEKLKEIINEARNNGVNLKDNVVSKLEKADYNHHIAFLIEGSENEKGWGYAIVKERTERILEIVWNRVFEWLK